MPETHLFLFLDHFTLLPSSVLINCVFCCHLSSISRLDRDHLRRQGEYSQQEVLRPGVTRISLPYFFSNEAASYIISAITMVAQHGWKLLPQYRFDPESGLFQHHQHRNMDRIWLSSLSFENITSSSSLSPSPPLPPSPPPSYEEMLTNAKRIFDDAKLIKVPLYALCFVCMCVCLSVFCCLSQVSILLLGGFSVARGPDSLSFPGSTPLQVVSSA